MENREQEAITSRLKIQPRLVIHGGAGNILKGNLTKEEYDAYRSALLSIVSKTNDFMNSSVPPSAYEKHHSGRSSIDRRPSALEVATHAVTQLEDSPLFNSGHGAVFTRDGINELEASVMVSRGFKKRGVGVMGLRRVRNPILLARGMLEHGEVDLAPAGSPHSLSLLDGGDGLDVPSAQGHTQVHGATAEKLAMQYGLDLVDPSYFFTQKRWDEHIHALEREKAGLGTASWDADDFLPQGTCGAVALDEDGVICAATSTGGMTNKLTGRIGDTPVVGAGFWAEEWDEKGDPTKTTTWERLSDVVRSATSGISLAGPLKGLMADCLPTPWLYTPMLPEVWNSRQLTTSRAMGASGTGNGDSFLRINAVRSVAAIARYKPETSSKALSQITGPGGELQMSAGDRWNKTGEGQGGMIGIECAVVRSPSGKVVGVRSEILMDFNCGGMYRAWIGDDGRAVMSIWSNGGADEL